MRLLVSLYSSTEEAPEALVLVTPASRAVEPVPLPGAGLGASGLCVVGDTVYCVADRGRAAPDEAERSELFALDRETLAVRWRYEFEIGRDVHSIAADGDRLYAVSTGTDELLVLRVGPAEVMAEDVVWRPDQAAHRTDLHHLNAVARVGERLLIAGLGPKPAFSSEWRDARDGFVCVVPSGDRVLGPLYHPHSLCRLSTDEVAACESPRRRVVTSAGRRSAPLPGYARGLCLAGGELYVGTSRGRRRNEPSSLLAYPGGVGMLGGVCALCRLDAKTLEVEDVLSLEPHGREVYDVVALTPTS